MSAQPLACVALPTPHDTSDISALFERLMQALNNNDGSQLDDVFTADLMLVDAEGRRLNDWQKAGDVFSALYENEVRTWKMTCQVLRIMLVDRNVAIVNTMHHLVAPSASSVSNVTSVVIRRTGRWWIAASHSGPFESATG